MNCCDDNGRCTGGHNCAARTVRTCDELGLCQERTPRCAGCVDRFPDPMGGLGLLAPGTIQAHRRPRWPRWLGTPAQRRQLLTWLMLLAFLASLVAALSMATGYWVGSRAA